MKTNKNIYVYLILALICIALYFLFHFIPNKKLEKDHRYTIATIIKIEMPLEGGEMADIHYYVYNETFKSSFTIDPNSSKKYKRGDRVYVKFFPKDPSVSELVFEKCVSDSIQKIPIEGWDKLPE